MTVIRLTRQLASFWTIKARDTRYPPLSETHGAQDKDETALVLEALSFA